MSLQNCHPILSFPVLSFALVMNWLQQQCFLEKDSLSLTAEDPANKSERLMQSISGWGWVHFWKHIGWWSIENLFEKVKDDLNLFDDPTVVDDEGGRIWKFQQH